MLLSYDISPTMNHPENDRFEKDEKNTFESIHTQKQSVSISRRRFLMTSAVGAAGVGVLGSAQRAAAATGEHTLVIEGLDSEASFYSFGVGGNLEKSTANGAGINDSDTIYENGAYGRVTAGKDAYTFDGPLYSFNIVGSEKFRVTLDGEAAHVGRRPDFLLVIEGQGPNTQYSFSTGGNLSKSTAYGAGTNSDDEIFGYSAHGNVRGGKDAYTFDGGVYAFNYDSSRELRVLLNGATIDVENEFDHYLMIEGTGPRTSYTFSTSQYPFSTDTNGAKRNSDDTVSENTVHGFVSGGKDAYQFRGDLLAFDFDRSGGVEVTLDGKPARVGNRPDHLLEIEADEERCKYLFETEGSVYEIEGIDPEDEVSDRKANGYVEGSDRDVYGYDGDLYVINTDNYSATFRRDGEEIQPDPY